MKDIYNKYASLYLHCILIICHETSNKNLVSHTSLLMVDTLPVRKCHFAFSSHSFLRPNIYLFLHKIISNRIDFLFPLKVTYSVTVISSTVDSSCLPIKFIPLETFVHKLKTNNSRHVRFLLPCEISY